MSSYQYSAAYDSPRGSRDRYQDELEDTGDLETPVQTKAPSIPTISVTSPAKKSRKSRRHSDSDTETQPAQMSSRSSKHHSSSSSSSSKKHSSSSKSKSKAKAKPELTDDWTDVTVPEERRRIQNRIAQRKFREKAREQKEQAERDQRNQDLAGSSYHIPEPEDLGPDDEQLSGLPWGGPSMQYVVARGHESASQQGSRRASDHVFGDTPTYMNPYGGMYQGWDGQGSSGAEEMGYEESSPYYDYYDTSGASSSR